MHTDSNQIKQGHIFLFNHFSRVETFMPQYFIYKETGAYCRSIAASSFFTNDNHFSNLLSALGVVPNNHPELMALLARDILAGRKIIVFPEGGMVKDRKVLTDDGDYRIYSRKNDEHRKLHTGAARLAYGLFIFKAVVRNKLKHDRYTNLKNWADELGFDSVDELEAAAQLPTNIVPANITFYPLRVNENVLSKGVEYFYKGLSERLIEELIIEGNLLLKKTDMDIRCGETFSVDEGMQWHDRMYVKFFANKLPNLNSIFDNEYVNSSLAKKLITPGIKRSVNNIRDYYMQAMYSAVTINSSHILSVIIFQLLEKNYAHIDIIELKKV
ncbi:MAG: 1-acyl-sn-glycerol-3-phosphate acyltransferase, partial [Pseudomonadota bacterium]